ncbi:unnamed protein product [Rhodiola kirilowii]
MAADSIMVKALCFLLFRIMSEQEYKMDWRVVKFFTPWDLQRDFVLVLWSLRRQVPHIRQFR